MDSLRPPRPGPPQGAPCKARCVLVRLSLKANEVQCGDVVEFPKGVRDWREVRKARLRAASGLFLVLVDALQRLERAERAAGLDGAFWRSRGLNLERTRDSLEGNIALVSEGERELQRIMSDDVLQ